MASVCARIYNKNMVLWDPAFYCLGMLVITYSDYCIGLHSCNRIAVLFSKFPTAQRRCVHTPTPLLLVTIRAESNYVIVIEIVIDYAKMV